MKNLLEQLDKKIKNKIKEEWDKDHYSDMSEEWFKGEYEEAYENLLDFLLTQSRI